MLTAYGGGFAPVTMVATGTSPGQNCSAFHKKIPLGHV